ncbi:unnamed protein product (macronuclear) [Paramecium tetraurelia]|uniref:Uncharacterized protein n=1 Tax=Paramecium tetraurelia TaxID=5888 RepID=A0DXK3_PARTE|nr:uncharacterized protein GSPATT00021394001 [Paramecium tetraurelia]CAK87770.1 unnamed protein product [Paramecium tetraurelia]|eukprot:XP_001455167.1 hypothetical protein (macronuclear) [Paramecium tetraurelia strain d4-2]
MSLLEEIQQEVRFLFVSFVQITNYFPKLTNKLQELGQSTITIQQPNTALKGIQIIISVLDDLFGILLEIHTQYAQLEEQLQKYEGECRSHIRTEQRLKIHCENIQELYEQQLNIEKDHKAQILSYQKEITQLKKDIEDNKHQKNQQLQHKTQSIIDKILLDQQKQTIQLDIKSRSNTFHNNFMNLNQQKQSMCLKTNTRKNRMATEYQDYQTKQILQVYNQFQIID